jgi:hypothetical protein
MPIRQSLDLVKAMEASPAVLDLDYVRNSKNMRASL